MTTKLRTVLVVTAIAASGLASGCASQSSFGDSVRHVTQQQIFDLDAAYNPNPAPVLGADAEMLNNVIETHRQSVSYPAQGSSTPTMSFGSGNQ
ncbi:MAG TPA: hypothetical protein VE175_07735 [Woeseiaceae bacterium]|jgi:hypothetical protein|nr:hypothetical protein [Woeseiaceae bacterium]